MRQNLSVIQESGVTIVHESEAQRQHIRLKMPIYVEIGGRVISTHDWSAGGVALDWPEGVMQQLSSSLAIGKRLEGHMIFTFDGFDLTMPMRFETRHLNREARRIGCRFAGLDRRQMSLLQFFTSAYIAGEVIRAGDILDVVSRNNFTARRAIPDAEEGLDRAGKLRRRMKRWAGVGLVVLASLGLATYVAAAAYEKLYVVQASSASVATDLVAVESPAAGKVFFQPQPLDAEVQVGEPLLTITTGSGSAISIDSPCKCVIKERLADSQAWARSGQPLMKLAPVDAEPYVKAYIRFEDALKVAPDQQARIAVRGMKDMKGVVTGIRADAPGSAGFALVTIAPEETLPIASIDDPALVRIDTFAGE